MESGGGEANYWPGFVDALSNVVLTLVFVLVIFVFALVMASNKVEEKMQQVIQAQKEEKVEQSQSALEIQKLQEELAKAQAELKARDAQKDGKSKSESEDTGVLDQNASSEAESVQEIVVQKTEVEEHQGSSVSVEKNKNKITILFPESVVNLDDASMQELSKNGDLTKAKDQKMKVRIRSIVGKETYTAAQRLAYYRALSTRNFLISKGGIDPTLISSVIVKPDVPEAGRVEILFSQE
jgi:outer membrane protein OmpA-like peptidoglycan-associated protein